METIDQCQYTHRLIDKLHSTDKNKCLNFKLIQKAIFWAKKYHGQQKRKTGHPFYSHPLEVAYMISDYLLKTDVIVASILHDIIEDTEVTAGMVVDKFGWRIGEMVDALTRDRPDGTKLSVEAILNNAYKKNDKEVLLIKIIDRLHNMQTIRVNDSIKQIKVSQQTLSSIIPICAYLGNIKVEFEIGKIVNKILKYKSKNFLLRGKYHNQLLSGKSSRDFMDLFKF